MNKLLIKLAMLMSLFAINSFSAAPVKTAPHELPANFDQNKYNAADADAKKLCPMECAKNRDHPTWDGYWSGDAPDYRQIHCHCK